MSSPPRRAVACVGVKIFPLLLLSLQLGCVSTILCHGTSNIHGTGVCGGLFGVHDRLPSQTAGSASPLYLSTHYAVEIDKRRP